MKLKACPFCGGDFVRLLEGKVVQCLDCDGEAPVGVWNTRVTREEVRVGKLIVIDESDCSPRPYQACIHGIPMGQECPDCKGLEGCS